MSLLVPPSNFGMVSDGVYRSAEPSELNFPFLDSLRLRTILHLAHSPPSHAVACFVDDHNAFPPPNRPHTALTLTHLAAQQHSSHSHQHHTTAVTSPPHSHASVSSSPATSSLTEHSVTAALTLLLSPSQLPCLVCCPTGGGATGVVVGCYRRVEGWSLQAIYGEYRRHAEGEGGGMNEQSIELFDVELVGGSRRGRAGKGRLADGGSGGGGGGGADRRRESESSLSSGMG